MRVCSRKVLALQLDSIVRRYAKQFRHRVRKTALILAYHRVADVDADPQMLCVSPKNFEEQMQVVRRFWQPVPLSRATNPNPRNIAVTFDDGYADNLHNAKRILERNEIPATVFVTTGSIGSEAEFWWDELERLLLPDQRALYLEMHQKIRTLVPARRMEVLESLRKQHGGEAKGRESHRALTTAEVARLSDGDLVEIGAHTVNHPVLSALVPEQQRSEIELSKARLEEITGKRVGSFAYPFGSVNDYTAETVAIVRNAGFTRACSNFPALVRQGTDCFQLPRVLVRNWNGDEFARQLQEWF